MACVARVLDRRDRGDVQLAVEQQPVELGRNAGDLLTSYSSRWKTGAMLT